MSKKIDTTQKKTISELKEFLEDSSNECFIKYNFFGYWYGDSIFGLNVKEVHKYGGRDEGYNYGNVLEFKDDSGETLNVEFFGYWVSYEGSTYRDCRYVEPKQKTITVWE